MSNGTALDSAPVPPTVVIDGARLVAAKKRVNDGDQAVLATLANLKAQADYWLHEGPWSVTDKSKPAPSGSIHDYASQALYWWKSPDAADGLPYVERDGEVNPEINEYPERTYVEKLYASTYLLSLAWYYTGERKYAEHAALILKTWFLDAKTAMTPHLNHAQLIPGRNTGQGTGIIDFSCDYTNVLDAAAILSLGAPGWSPADHEAFKAWNGQFLTWLTESKNGKEAMERSNNHATFALMQICAIALFTDNAGLAASTAEVAKRLIDEQIAPDGSQPEEMNRTCSWHYCNFNLVAHLRIALTAKKVGVDLFGYAGPQGQSIFKAVEYLVAAAVGGESQWPFKDKIFKWYAGTDNVHAAADAGLASAKEVDARLPPPPGGDLFVLRPAPQQLHSATASSHLVKTVS